MTEWEPIKVMRFKDGGLVIATGDQDVTAPNVELFVPKQEAEQKIEKLEAERDRARKNNAINNERAEKAEAERDQALKQGAEEERERLRETGLMLQKWAREKRRQAKDVVGPAEKLKAEWIAKGYDNAADALFAAIDQEDSSEQ